MATQGRRGGPYVAVAGGELTTAEPDRNDAEPAPAPAHPRWLKSLASYARRHWSEIHGGRYG